MNYSRRQFLGHAGIAATAATQLSWMPTVARADVTQGYKALVCILLAGGNDSFNMLLPNDDQYAGYASVRADLALPQADLLPLTGNQAGQFAVHPGMPEVQSLFDGGDLAFVANIGPLAEPTTRAAYDTETVRLPLGLFSHSDQIAVWQTAAAGQRVATGFGGRLADLVEPQVQTGPVSMNISVAGTNLFQTGAQAIGYAVDAREGVRTIGGYGEGESEIFTTALDALLAQNYSNPFRQAYANNLRGAIDSGAALQGALSNAVDFGDLFGNGPLSTALAQIARLISIRDILGVSRQTFFVTVGGWDHHDEVLENQAAMLPGISQGLSEFHAALTAMGVLQDVVTFSISDFGRTLTSNGRGSDHGWGGNNLVMGGGLAGGRVYGEYPEMALGTELDLGRGRFLPTTSVDEFYAELGLWYGVQPGELDLVLPNIGRFYDVSGAAPPIGYLLS